MTSGVGLRLLAFSVSLLLVATSAFGQRLLSVVPTGDDPTSVGGWDVTVHHDVVRSAPPRLELSAPDGGVLSPEMRVFEDRGDGNAMWVGGYPELGYDNVVLTLQDGYLLGRFGMPEGGTYWIRAGADGAGRMSEGGPSSAGFCGVVPGADPVTAVTEAQRDETPERVVRPSNHDRLDILMLYTADAAARLEQAGWGGPNAAMQHAMDYLNLVFRNNQFSISANMVHLAEAPAVLGTFSSPINALANDEEVRELRAEHGADIVHLFFNAGIPGFCGQASLMMKHNQTPQQFAPLAFGVTTVGGGCIDVESQVPEGEHANFVETFAHEIGHNLGANHDPDSPSVDPEDAVEPYAFGHHNFELQPNVKSVMSYNEGRQEPFFSNVRVPARGVVLGVANERENERALRRTLTVGVRFSDHLPDPGEPPPPPQPPPPGGPAAPANLQVLATGSTSVRVTWIDRSGNEDGFQVHARLQGGGWATVATVPANTESADIDGLESGGRYDFRVRAYNRDGGRNSSVFTLVLHAADYTDCVPSASQITFEHGFSVSMCVEYQKDGETVVEDAKNYDLESRESGILYFFDRDNAEVLVKVLDACAVNQHRWVFVAPVTDLAFNLYVEETATGKVWEHRNPKGGQTASTESDVAAFPCGAAAASAVGDGVGDATGVELVDAGFPVPRTASPSAPVTAGPTPVGVAQAIGAGEATDCEPQPVTTLAGGYTVNMCVEYLKDGNPEVTEARDFGLDSQQSGLLYFFERSNAEVLIKVLDACGVNGYRWVFVAPVTDLAFNLSVVSPNPDDEVWTHSNRLSQTAAARSDNAAFACSN